MDGSPNPQPLSRLLAFECAPTIPFLISDHFSGDSCVTNCERRRDLVNLFHKRIMELLISKQFECALGGNRFGFT